MLWIKSGIENPPTLSLWRDEKKRMTTQNRQKSKAKKTMLTALYQKDLYNACFIASTKKTTNNQRWYSRITGQPRLKVNVIKHKP